MKRLLAVILVLVVALGVLVSRKQETVNRISVDFFRTDIDGFIIGQASSVIEGEDAQAIILVLEQQDWEQTGGLNCCGNYDITYNGELFRYHRWCCSALLEHLIRKPKLVELDSNSKQQLNQILDQYF